MLSLEKIPNKNRRLSTNDFHSMSINLDKTKKNKKSSKRQTIQAIGENPIISNSPVKSSLLSLHLLSKKYENYTPPKFSNRKIGPLKSFSYNSFRGLIKEYNEDRVSISQVIEKPSCSKFSPWPKMSYFAIFDGHGGDECAEYLKENYLKFLVKTFFKLKCKEKLEESDISGSCALVAVIFDNKLYIANIGDSRAIMSINGGNKIRQLTVDHKPDNLIEFERAIKNGSKIYLDDNDDPDRDITKLEFIKDKNELKKKLEEKLGSDEDKVFRVYPSDLAVMRTVGDIKAKKKEFGGNPGTIINVPDIFIYDINSNDDFIVMGCDGIFDDLSNKEIVDAAWMVFKHRGKNKNYDIHELSMEACDLVIKYAMEKQSTDNLSCIVIGLEGIDKYLKNIELKKRVNNYLNNKNN